MSEVIIKEWYFWITSVITGVGMAFSYDIIRLFRSLVHHNLFFINVEDLLYWIICFFTSFTLLYYGNNGVVRFSAVFGAAIGMTVYTASIGQIFVKYVSLIIKKIIFLLSKPILYMVHKVSKMFSKIMLFLKKYLFSKKLLFYKYRLTKKVNNTKIDIRYASGKKPFLKSKKEEASVYEKKKKKKNPGIPPSEE